MIIDRYIKAVVGEVGIHCQLFDSRDFSIDFMLAYQRRRNVNVIPYKFVCMLSCRVTHSYAKRLCKCTQFLIYIGINMCFCVPLYLCNRYFEGGIAALQHITGSVPSLQYPILLCKVVRFFWYAKDLDNY